MFGQVSHEVEVNVAAREAWNLYSTVRLAKFVLEYLPGLLDNVELLEGDGGTVGTVFRITSPPGTPGNIGAYKERFTKVDHENMIKEAESFEGGYLDVGFSLYRIRFQVIEKDTNVCVIKSSIDYDVNDEVAANASFITIEPQRILAEAAKEYLLKTTTAPSPPPPPPPPPTT